MTTKREVLQQLSRDELLAIVDSFDLEVADRRARDPLVEAIAHSKKATISAVLADYPRDRLRALCRAFSLDDGGREKAALIERLTGETAESAPVDAVPSSAKARGGKTNGAAKAAVEQIELTSGEVRVKPDEAVA